MKHPFPYAANCSLLFTEVPLLKRPAAARAAGFHAIESWWPFDTAVPREADVDRFVTAVQDADVELIGLNLAAGDMPGGDRGLLSWPARRTEFLDSVQVAISIGSQLGVSCFNALYGNRLDNASAQEQDDLAADNLATVAEAMASIGATVVVEPLSGVARYPLRTAADVIDVLDRVTRLTTAGNLRMLADLYHLTANGDDLDAVISRYADRIGHLQIADWPGRNEPGTGRINFDKHLNALEAAGYRGWAALEYQPATTTEQSLSWLPRNHRGADPISKTSQGAKQ
ncbi:hydroxypyruvate isomerase family protein [Nonomuraea recticatena]|uniref:TIM barrel protein n=1 Tax=Nonomuraea recticatena TaxID=46178 RepID=A0ABN3TEM4_9ACTN